MRIIAAFRFKEVNVEVASNVNRFVRGVKPFIKFLLIKTIINYLPPNFCYLHSCQSK